eukprot:TRINITY_DN13264_c0_g1_i3.p1 TRINITY_DN13264_c0_g1~~TRINITY_DN13264_c0_g1_i3.p1  ORF type:complete len:261 (+),score=72.06 TRINITY_DN13264_c0_g1_i3:67-849(+)
MVVTVCYYQFWSGVQFIFFFFFNDTATTEIYTLHIVGSVRCVQETGTWDSNGITNLIMHYGTLDEFTKQYIPKLLDSLITLMFKNAQITIKSSQITQHQEQIQVEDNSEEDDDENDESDCLDDLDEIDNNQENNLNQFNSKQDDDLVDVIQSPIKSLDEFDQLRISLEKFKLGFENEFYLTIKSISPEKFEFLKQILQVQRVPITNNVSVPRKIIKVKASQVQVEPQQAQQMQVQQQIQQQQQQPQYCLLYTSPSPRDQA